MGIIYGFSGIGLSISLIITFFINIKNSRENRVPIVVPWMLLGISYSVIFLIIAIYSMIPMVAIYAFQVTSGISIIYFSRQLRFSRLPILLSVIVCIFLLGWTVMSMVSNQSIFSTLLPIIIVLASTLYTIAIYYFTNTEEKIILKTVLGSLFVIYAVAKILYIIEIVKVDKSYYVGVFLLDYIIYFLISVLLYLNIYYWNFNGISDSIRTMGEIYNNVPYGMVLLNQQGQITIMNKNIRNHINHNVLQEQSVIELINTYSKASKAFMSTDWHNTLKTIENTGVYKFVLEEEHAEGIFERQFIFIPLVRKESKEVEILLTIYDYLEVNIKEIKLKLDEYKDEITGLPTHSEMIELFEKRMRNSRRDKFAVIVLALSTYQETLKEIGPDLIDEYMATIIDYIKEVDNIEYVGKIAEDTFELITSDIVEGSIQDITKDLMMNLRIPFEYMDNTLDTVVKIGVAMYPYDGIIHKELFDNAKEALVKAHTKGQEAVQYYGDIYIIVNNNKKDIEEKLKKALENNEFYMIYQPQYCTKDRSLRGLECFIRWGNYQVDFISPKLFIPIAEDIGIMDEIGEWVLHNSICKAIEWQKKYNNRLIIAINISGRQLERVGYAAFIKSILDDHQYPAELLELEVTESVLISLSEEAYRTLKELKATGVRIALNDFGTGYPSLEYLNWLPFNLLKINKSFIDNLNEDSIELNIVKSVIKLVDKLGLETMAVGVETEKQLGYLKDLNCDYIQGYIYSKPLKDYEVETMLEKIKL